MFIKSVLRFALEVLSEVLRIAAHSIRVYLRKTRHTCHATAA